MVLKARAIHRMNEDGYCDHCGSDMTASSRYERSPCVVVTPFVIDEDCAHEIDAGIGKEEGKLL
jgi:hypothetical protein